MKINVENIKKANDALTNVGIVKNGQYSKEMSGYISSFGASIVQSGLLATLIFYGNTESEAKERHKVVEAIDYIVLGEFKAKENLLATKMIKEKSTNDKELLNKVTDAAVALKLALRMYNKKS